MAEGGVAPPPEAMRKGGGVSAVVAIAIAVVTFLGGLGVGAFVLVPAPTPAKPLLVLGTNTPFPPFEDYDDNQNLVGFDIDLVQEMATRAGYTYAWRDFTDFDALLFAIAARGVDVGVGALTQNGDTGTKRNESLKFTDPYYESDQGVLRKTSDTTNYCAAADCTVDELNLATLIIGAQASTTSYFWACDNLPAVADCDTEPPGVGPDADNLISFPKVPQVLQALQAGTVDIVIIDKPAADGIATQNPTTYTVEGTIQTNELYGFAVAKADPKGLIPKLNTALADMRRDGTYVRIFDKWF
jgi:ABC-type amino acid transport substrate-binding protein